MEVMGLMLGEFMDEYTICVVDVFAMPQSGMVFVLKLLIMFFRLTCLTCLNKPKGVLFIIYLFVYFYNFILDLFY